MAQTRTNFLKDVTSTVREWPILPHPFIDSYFVKKIYEKDKSVKSKPKLYRILVSETRRAKYILVLLELGRDLQKALSILQTERKVYLNKNLKHAIRFTGMDCLKSVSEHRSTFLDQNKLTDGIYLAWHEAFTRCLFQLSEYIQHFVIFSDTTRLPAFSDVQSKFPTPE